MSNNVKNIKVTKVQPQDLLSVISWYLLGQVTEIPVSACGSLGSLHRRRTWAGIREQALLSSSTRSAHADGRRAADVVALLDHTIVRAAVDTVVGIHLGVKSVAAATTKRVVKANLVTLPRLQGPRVVAVIYTSLKKLSNTIPRIAAFWFCGAFCLLAE